MRDLLLIRRGISTGLNDFFVLTEEEVETQKNRQGKMVKESFTYTHSRSRHNFFGEGLADAMRNRPPLLASGSSQPQT